MFPNFRLMIATVFASVLALICGFGVFATLHVRHEPFVRLPPAIPPLQLLADNSVTLSVSAAEPFGHLFQSGEREGGGGLAALPYSAIQPTAAATKAVLPAADDHDSPASEREPVTLPADAGDAAVPAQQAAVGGTAQDRKPDEAAQATKPDEAAPVTKPDAAAPERQPDPAAAETANAQAAPAAPTVASGGPAAAEPPSEEAQPAEQTTKSETEAASSTIEPAPATPETDTALEKNTERPRVAAKAHITRRVRVGAIASKQHGKRNSTLSVTTFVTAPQSWSEQGRRQAATTERSRTTATPSGSSTAMGGPFVSAPNE